MFHGYILNDDGTQVSVVMLRDTGSLQSLITEDCFRKYNYSILNNFCSVKGITEKIIRTPLVQVNLSSDLANGNVAVGVHNHIPPYFDILIENDLVNPNNTLCLKDDILVVTRAQSVLKQDANIQQQNNAHSDHVVNSMFDVGEQKVNLPQSVTISDNPSCVDDFPDLPNLFVETETLNWEEIINLDRGKLQKLQSECHSLKELFKVINIITKKRHERIISLIMTS